MVNWQPTPGSVAVSRVGLEEPPSGVLGAPLLHVHFVKGHTYVYKIPDRSYFTNFVNAASKGRYYDYVIKKKFHPHIMKYD